MLKKIKGGMKKKAEGTKKKMNRMLKMRMKIRMIDGD